MRHGFMLVLVGAAALSGCAGGAGVGGFGGYSLVQPGPRAVAADRLTVSPPQAWNRVPRGFYDIREEENWTLNGPILDSVSFVAGLKDGKAIVRQRRREDRLVPVFRAAMTPLQSVGSLASGAAQSGTDDRSQNH